MTISNEVNYRKFSFRNMPIRNGQLKNAGHVWRDFPSTIASNIILIIIIIIIPAGIERASPFPCAVQHTVHCQSAWYCRPHEQTTCCLHHWPDPAPSAVNQSLSHSSTATPTCCEWATVVATARWHFDRRRCMPSVIYTHHHTVSECVGFNVPLDT